MDDIYITQDGDQISFPIEDYSSYASLSDANRQASGELIFANPGSGTPTSTDITFEWRLLENRVNFVAR